MSHSDWRLCKPLSRLCLACSQLCFRAYTPRSSSPVVSSQFIMPRFTNGRNNRRATVLCTGCNQSVYPTGRRWNPISQLCVSCDTRKSDAAARLTIRLPPRRLCTLCSQVHAVPDLQNRDGPTRCRSCQRRKRCSACFVLKKTKPFLNANHRNELFKTCQSCRDKRFDRVRIERDAAHAVGLRWCVLGKHHTTADACTSVRGVLHACDYLSSPDGYLTLTCIHRSGERHHRHRRRRPLGCWC
jgi:hypothetical protein